MGLPEIINEKSKKLITWQVFSLLMTRKLEHIANETFKNEKGEMVRAHLITKQPILLRAHGADLMKQDYIERTRAFADIINKRWDELAYLHRGKADSFIVSSETTTGYDNTCFCAVNFYKTE